MYVPGKGFERCFCNSGGFKRNSNHNTVSGEMGTVPGRNKSTSIIGFFAFFIPEQSSSHIIYTKKILG